MCLRDVYYLDCSVHNICRCSNLGRDSLHICRAHNSRYIQGRYCHCSSLSLILWWSRARYDMLSYSFIILISCYITLQWSAGVIRHRFKCLPCCLAWLVAMLLLSGSLQCCFFWHPWCCIFHLFLKIWLSILLLFFVAGNLVAEKTEKISKLSLKIVKN